MGTEISQKRAGQESRDVGIETLQMPIPFVQ